MRLFVALNIPADVKRELQAVQLRVRAQIGRNEGRWCTAEQMHLTVRFLGEVAPNAVRPLTQKLEAVCSLWQPFVVSATGLGCFPPRRPPRVLWAGLINKNGELNRLQRSISETTEAFTKEPPDVRFQAHVTLARFPFIHPLSANQLAKICSESVSQAYGSWTVPELALIQSVLSSAGSHYTTLARLPFADRGNSGSA
jgi:2'-5' RNA ligase